MNRRPFFGYVRVSTLRQGEKGVSLLEQRDAIERFADRAGLDIVQWFEETETAAKRGRPIFTAMIRLLKKRVSEGVIVHKIDRSARNLKDWAELGELIDSGVVVHFANENLDLSSRGGRLSADIQAVVAADYIRNLREEVRKGMWGRLKQGHYPWAAPIGYLNKGQGGKLKEIDPEKGPLVRKLFELYATGKFTLTTLTAKAEMLGLKNRKGGRVSLNGISIFLNNPFYIGLIRIRSTGETYQGAHEPLVPKYLFDQVQDVLNGKTNTKVQKHDFVFRRMLKCAACDYHLRGELQKGHVYYRCHTRTCPITCLKEEEAEQAVLAALAHLSLTEMEQALVHQQIEDLRHDWTEEREQKMSALSLRRDQIAERLNRLTDAYLDRAIERDLYEERKTALLMERRDTDEKIVSLKSGEGNIPDRIALAVELASQAHLAYQAGSVERKRELLKSVGSNLTVSGWNVDVTMAFPFSAIADRTKLSKCGHQRNIGRTIARTWKQLLPKIISQLAEHGSPGS